MKLLAIFLLSLSLISAHASDETYTDEEWQEILRESSHPDRYLESIGLEGNLDEIIEEQMAQDEQYYPEQDMFYYGGEEQQRLPKKSFFIPFSMDKGDMIKAGVAAGSAIIFFKNDEDIMSFVQEHKTEVTEKIAVAGERWGAGTEAVLASGAGYIIGVVVKNEKVKSISKIALKSMLYSGLLTRALKTSLRRVRPKHSTDDAHQWFGTIDDHSFPSGHTTLAFSVGTFIAESYKGKSKMIPILAYSASAIAGWSRVHDKAHWASDVVVGAFIGHMITKQVMNNRDPRKAGFVFSPYRDESGTLVFGFRYQHKQPRHVSNCNKQADPVRACIREAFERSQQQKSLF